MAGKKKIKIRDYYIVLLIAGATKSGIHVDRKKKSNKNNCRKKVKETDE
jgi:hypothetical protein